MTTDVYKVCPWKITEWGEFPKHFSDNACRIVSAQYFRAGETSFAQVVARIVGALLKGFDHYGYDAVMERGVFQNRLIDMLVHQKFAFNSPVYYNLGVYENPQCSACFIQSVDDDMDSIMDLAKNEAMLFKHGSGTGTNLSPLRGSTERLSKSDGTASGPVSFMEMYDSVAAVVKSGGRTRRAAKMQILDIDHPDIVEFIECKAKEDRKAKALITSGMDPQEAYASVKFQNLNHSVMITDEFMNAVHKDEDWYVVHRVSKIRVNIGKARKIWRLIAKCAWECGDPGVMFRDTINKCNVIPHVAPINASNPCSEFVFVDESACNLGSFNIMKYMRDDFQLSRSDLAGDVRVAVVAMDIIVSISSYPTKMISNNSHRYRPLGIGFSNLGAALMHQGLPYSSPEGREFAQEVASAIMLEALITSEFLGQALGSFEGFDAEVFNATIPWLNWGVKPMRNAQLTLVAPTGTISFMMDCESTGIEPVLAERQVKTLAGGGELEITPQCVTSCPNSAAVETAIGKNPVSWKGHVDMMAAVQPYLSGAISKTVNLPESATIDDILDVYSYAAEKGIKCLAVYRDGSKSFQPLVDRDKKTEENPARRRLSDTRGSVTHKFTVGGVEGYMTVGLFDDGTPGEVFVNIAREGSTTSGFMDSWATMLSLSLQYGIPWSKLREKFRGSKFEPSGFTANSELPMVSSIVDYIVRWIDMKFHGAPAVEDSAEREEPEPKITHGDTCPECGSLLYITGTCKTCGECGWGGGCG